MKLSKSKLALAKVINENGGWVDGAKWAAQDKRGATYKLKIWFYSGNEKPYTAKGCATWQTDYKIHDTDAIQYDKLLPNWHQTCISREEYYQAYPKVDADGWIEWNGGECPVEASDEVDTKHRVGRVDIRRYANSAWWYHTGGHGDIVAYRPSNQYVKPEFCKSVTLSVSESRNHEKLSPEAVDGAKVALMSEIIEESTRKPTIEQLAQDYRNAKYYAVRLQKEAGEAAVKAESFAVEIRKKILELKDLIG